MEERRQIVLLLMTHINFNFNYHASKTAGYISPPQSIYPIDIVSVPYLPGSVYFATLDCKWSGFGHRNKADSPEICHEIRYIAFVILSTVYHLGLSWPTSMSKSFRNFALWLPSLQKNISTGRLTFFSFQLYLNQRWMRVLYITMIPFQQEGHIQFRIACSTVSH